MGKFFGWLLGIREGEWAPGRTTLEFVHSPLGLAVLAALAAYAVLWVYRRENGTLSPRLRLFLAGLRVATLALLLALLFEPILAVERSDSRHPRVLFLLDNSLSQSIQGNEYTNPAKKLQVARLLFDNPQLAALTPDQEKQFAGKTRWDLTKAILKSKSLDWPKKLSAIHPVSYYTFSTQLKPVGEQPVGKPIAELGLPQEPEGNSTRLGDAIREAIAAQSKAGQPIAGVVLLTDGQSNAGEDPMVVARYAGSRKPDSIPLFAIGIGSDEEQRDAEVVSIQAPLVVIQGSDPFEIKVNVRSHGFAGKTARLVLLRNDQQVDAKEVSFDETMGSQEFAFRQEPSDLGEVGYTARLENLPEGDLLANNNSQSQTVKVVDQKFKILYVEGSPRWEYRKLQALLERKARDKVFEYSILLQSAEPKWPQPASSTERRLTEFPREYKDLVEKYDLIIFGDVNPDHETMSGAGVLEGIQKFVEEGGGGFVMIAGRFHSPLSYRGTAIEKILPVYVEASEQETTIPTPFSVKWNPKLEAHPLLRIDPDPAQSRTMWEELFHPYWHYHINEVKPAAKVLLQHASDRTTKQEPCPLMTYMQAGQGLSFFLSIDETWRWPRGIPEESERHPFNRFWNQTIKFLAQEKLTRGNKSMVLRLDKEEYSIGEKALLTLKVLDSAAAEGASDVQSVEVRYTTPGKLNKTRTLKRQAGGKTFVGDVPIEQKGHYEIAYQPPGATEPLCQSSFDAREFTAEYANPLMNRKLLTELTAASGGKYLDLSELQNLPDLLKGKTKKTPQRIPNPLMDAPLVFGLFCVFLVTEWIVRKRSRLM